MASEFRAKPCKVFASDDNRRLDDETNIPTWWQKCLVTVTWGLYMYNWVNVWYLRIYKEYFVHHLGYITGSFTI